MLICMLIFNNRQPPYGHFRTVTIWIIKADMHDVPASASFCSMEQFGHFLSCSCGNVDHPGVDWERAKIGRGNALCIFNGVTNENLKCTQLSFALINPSFLTRMP